MKGLKHLYIGGVGIKTEEADAVRKALPDCLVSWWKQPEITMPQRRRFGN
jgi:hypothetical protein